MTQRQQVIAAHRFEGEPQPRVRVQGMCEERRPPRSSIQWIEPADPRTVSMRSANSDKSGTAGAASKIWHGAYPLGAKIGQRLTPHPCCSISPAPSRGAEMGSWPCKRDMAQKLAAF